MAKARGNKLVPPANYSRNPMGQQVREMLDRDGGISPGGKPMGMVDRGTPPVRVRPGFLEQNYYMGTPNSPPNQGLDFSGLLALYGENRPSQQTGRNPRLTTPNTPLVSNSMMPYRGPSAVDMAGDRASAAQIRNSANQINSLIARSQAANPMVPRSPGFGVVDPATESTRRLAPMLAQDAARQQNTPMNGMTAYEADPMRYRPGDQAIQARQLDNAQRMTSGRPVDRTRSNPMADQINSQANAVANGRGWYLGGQFVGATGTPESARQAQLAGKSEREALRDRSNLNVPQAELDRRNNADMARRERQARHNQFKDANNGMNYRQYDRMQSQNALTMKAVDEGRLSPDAANLRMQTRADKALRRAGNPMMMGSDESRRLFPDMTAGRGGRAATPNQNPMAAFGMGASNTPAGKLAAAGNVSNMATTDPNLVALGVDPAAGIGGLHTSLSQQFEADPNLAMDDSSLRSYQMFAQQALTADPDQANPSNFASFPGSMFAETEGAVTSELWKELATLPDSERARQQWLQKYKDRKKEIEKRQTDYYGSYGS